jgi:hypothetical protein
MRVQPNLFAVIQNASNNVVRHFIDVEVQQEAAIPENVQ